MFTKSIERYPGGMMTIEIEFGRTVIEEFWTLSKDVQNVLLIKAIRGARAYGREPNKPRYHAVVTVEGWDDKIDVIYHNPSKKVTWKKKSG